MKQIGMNDPKQHKFTDLKPGTKYTVVVVSRSGDQTSAAVTQDFHTSKLFYFMITIYSTFNIALLSYM